MTFEEQLWLLVIDKVFLGALVALVAYIGSRTFERFRTRLSLIAEADRLRVQKIAELWEAFGDVSFDLALVQETRRRIVIEETGKLGPAEQNELLARKQLPVSAVERLQKEALPVLQAALRRQIGLPALVERKRVWAGQALHEKHLTYLRHLQEFAGVLDDTMLSGNPVDVLERLKASLDLKLSRLDVPALVREL